MKKLMVTLRNNLIKISLSIFVLFLMFTGTSCLDGIDGINSPSSTNPFGAQIILVNVPEDLFGNLCDPLQIEVIVNRELTPNGSTVLFELNSQNIELGLRGCISGSDTDITSGSADTVITSGRALADYLSGLVVGQGEIGTVNVGVTIIPPNGDPQSDFGVILLKGIDFTPPPEQTIETRQPDDPLSIFVLLQFTTIGIPPTKAILVESKVVCDLSDPSLGSLSPTSPEIVGRIESGAVVTQYTAVNGEGGVQVVTCRLILPNPSDKDPKCDPVPEVDRTLEAIVKIIQTVPEPEPTPTPTPAPPTPPPSIDCTAFNEEIPPGGNTIITATTNTGSLTDVCCDIPPLFQSVPPSFLDDAPPEATVCGLTDANSSFFTKLTAGFISPLDIQFIRVRCCIDDDPMDLMCNLVETQCDVGVTINPDIAPPTQGIEIIADPASVEANGTTLLIATTDPTVDAGTPICFGILFNSTPPSFLFPPPFCVGATSSGEALIELAAGAVITTGESVTVQACIDENLSSACDVTDPSDFVIVPIVPLPPTPPPPTPPPTPIPTPTPTPILPTIDVEALNEELPPGGETVITATTNTGLNTPVCCDIPIQSDPTSSLDGFPPTPVCGTTDINSQFFTILTGGQVITFQPIQVRCCIDSNTITGTCDPEEVQDSVFVDITGGAPPQIELTADLTVIPPLGTSNITALTTPPVTAGTDICFKIIINSDPNSQLFFDLSTPLAPGATGCADASSLGEAVIGLLGGDVMTQQAVTILGCIDEDAGMDCDPIEPSNFVTVTVAPPAPTPAPTATPSPPGPIQIVAVNPFPPAGGSTFINVFTNPPVMSTDELCVKIISNSTPVSTITGTLIGPPVGTACANPNVGGDVIGLISLNIAPLASGDQISLQGCIDINMNLMCDAGIDTFSPIIIVNVP